MFNLILFLQFAHSGKHLRWGSVTDLVQGCLEFSVKPDVWFWSVLQAVGAHGILCVFTLRTWSDCLHLACLLSRQVLVIVWALSCLPCVLKLLSSLSDTTCAMVEFLRELFVKL